MDSRPTSDADHQYLVERGFGFDPARNQYVRLVGRNRHYLSANAAKATPQRLVWSAVAIGDEHGGMAVVVKYREGFTEVIPCFVTAEIRLWQRQD